MHDIFVLIAYALLCLIIAHADVSSMVRDLHFGLSFHLHPYFEYASNECSGESALMADTAEPSLLADAISTEI